MGWHDDDFPNEDTDPNMQRGGRGAQHVPQQAGAQQGGYPPQQQGYPQQGMPQQHPHSTGGYPQQPSPTGGYPQQQGPPSGAVPIQHGPPSGVVPIQPGPNATPSGGYPQQGYNTGGFPQQQGPPPQSPSQVQKLAAPVVAVEEDAKASRVVYGLSGTAVGGVAGVVLGVLNTKLEGLTITAGTDFIFMCAIWFAFIAGLMCFLFPDRFAYTIMKWTKDDDDKPPAPPR